MSKKLAAGLDALVLDVKTGTGAFMSDEGDARQLARALVSTGNSCGVRTEALLTDMNQPLGRGVGHAIEVRECIEILRNETSEGARPVQELSVELAARMVASSGVESQLDVAREKIERVLQTGAALECFRRNVEAQGGDPRVCDEPLQLLPLTPHEVKVESTRTGFVTGINAAEIGHAIASIGGGRVRIEDVIDPGVGFASEAKIGDEVRAGDVVGLLYCRDHAQAQTVRERIQSAYTIGDTFASAPTLIKEVITA
jgi:pyrimidine-nucleoside phosphorylase